MNIAQLLHQSARRLPDRPALAIGERVVSSYSDLSKKVQRLSSGLAEKVNLKPGDRVALGMTNCPEYWQLLFACWHAGLVAVPMNAKLHAREFEYIVANCAAKKPDDATDPPHRLCAAPADAPGQWRGAKC